MQPTTFPDVTTFNANTDCDPQAADADLQVVQAFVAAYNRQDLSRLQELVDTDEIWDFGGLPHLAKALWTEIEPWAEKGWEVDDRFELVRVVRYGPLDGSDIIALRTNQLLTAAGIPELHVTFKVPSSQCVIERLIGGVEIDGPGSPGCLFYETFSAEILELNLDIEVPPLVCNP